MANVHRVGAQENTVHHANGKTRENGSNCTPEEGEHLVESVGKELRKMMTFLDAKEAPSS